MTRSLLVVTAALLAATAAGAQDFDEVEIRTLLLAPGLHMLVGQGGNLVVSTGADGPLLVDDQYAPLAPKIEAAVRALQDAPVRFVVNTHWHGDHTGGNEAFGRSGAVIVAQDAVRRRMSTGQLLTAMRREVPPSPRAALPVVTFADGVTLHWNDEEIAVEHVAPAHTDGDSLVWFRRADAVHMGDTYFSSGYPFIDLSSGGSLDGVLAAVDRVLGQVGEGTKIVPGHGPVSDRAGLRRYRTMLATVRERVQAALAAGTSLPDLQARRPLADLDPAWGGGFLDADRFLAIVYADLATGS